MPERTPKNRETSYAVIRTDSKDSQPAFESDAFAVLMPTTRLTILDKTVTPPKIRTPTASVEALKTYQEKARQGRERNNNQGVQIHPSLSATIRKHPPEHYTVHLYKLTPVHRVIREIRLNLSQLVRHCLRSDGSAREDTSICKDMEGRSNICIPQKLITKHRTNTSPAS